MNVIWRYFTETGFALSLLAKALFLSHKHLFYIGESLLLEFHS